MEEQECAYNKALTLHAACSYHGVSLIHLITSGITISRVFVICMSYICVGRPGYDLSNVTWMSSYQA
jgi:hypothetical protein